MNLDQHNQSLLSSGPLTIWYGFLFLPRGSTIHMGGASVRSRLTKKLVDAFLTRPGVPMSPESLAAALWPNDPRGIGLDGTRYGRVKVAICRLRATGLPIITMTGGYAIDPRTEIRIASAEGADSTAA